MLTFSRQQERVAPCHMKKSCDIMNFDLSGIGEVCRSFENYLQIFANCTLLWPKIVILCRFNWFSSWRNKYFVQIGWSEENDIAGANPTWLRKAGRHDGVVNIAHKSPMLPLCQPFVGFEGDLVVGRNVLNVKKASTRIEAFDIV